MTADHESGLSANFHDLAGDPIDAKITTSVTADRRADIRARLDAATPGPWETYAEPGLLTTGCDQGVASAVNGDVVCYHGQVLTADAELISHAPADLRWLLDEVERLEGEVNRWQEKAQEFGAAYALANTKHHEELRRAGRLERLADRLAEKAVDLEDRARAAEKRADALGDVIAKVRALHQKWAPLTYVGAWQLLRELDALLPDDTKEAE